MKRPIPQEYDPRPKYEVVNQKVQLDALLNDFIQSESSSPFAMEEITRKLTSDAAIY